MRTASRTRRALRAVAIVSALPGPLCAMHEGDAPVPLPEAEQIAAVPPYVVPGLRVVCQRMPPPPGTRIGGRNICKTQAEWDIYHREVRYEVQRLQDASHF